MTLSTIIAAWLAGLAGITPTSCTPGEHYMLVVDAHVPADGDTPAACVRIPVVTICGEPHRLAWTIDDEARPIDCGELAPGEVRRADTAEAYPHSLVGYVGRHAVELGEETLPAVEPSWGVCQGAGCYCAGACEHLPIGGPRGYWKTRLCRIEPILEVCSEAPPTP